ncbi:hypothetical protein DOTSEDRAFT_71526 [Dothistroma septosporum NZE10]|uniref:Uncharacterized protein n=1 Tax=Dothistroma septosporum (strain NZE10 / CBS 128990) TaxID=675120 RepID=N1PSE8_DOTSN|nr:hypothetical protein DOTSEDRAFT_71526 [Dothistroma septosporum NZE10]
MIAWPSPNGRRPGGCGVLNSLDTAEKWVMNNVIPLLRCLKERVRQPEHRGDECASDGSRSTTGTQLMA